MRISEAAADLIRSMTGVSRPNSVAAARFDLILFARVCDDCPVTEIDASKVTEFLATANSPATRKRRLASLRLLERHLQKQRIEISGLLTSFAQVRVASGLPAILSEDDEIAIVAAAGGDEKWSLLAIHLMLHCGLGRSDLLVLQPGDIRGSSGRVLVEIMHDETVGHPRNRMIAVSPLILDEYVRLRAGMRHDQRIFPFGPQAVNGMVDRVRKRAGISWVVTPRTLRDTCAANLARIGQDVPEMLSYLGMIDESRNRQTMQRLIDHYRVE